MIDFISKIIGFLASDQVLIIYVILILGCVLFYGKIASIFMAYGIRKILNSHIPKVNEYVCIKIEEVNYKEHYRQYLNLIIKACLYLSLLLASTTQIVIYFINNTDAIALRLAILTSIIALIETRDNYENSKEHKNISDRLFNELVMYRNDQTDKIIKEIVDDTTNEYNRMTDYEKLISIFGTPKRVRNISVLNGNRKLLYKGKVDKVQ